jgi:hypothetical protein
MVDMKSYYLDIDSRLQNPTKPHVTFTSREKSWVSDCSCPVCKQRKEQKTLTKKVPFVDYNGIFPEDEESLTPHQYFLLPQKLWGFVFKTRTWGEYLYASQVETSNSNTRGTRRYVLLSAKV